MKGLILTALVVVLFACGNEKDKDEENNFEDLGAILKKRDLYKTLVHEVQDDHGFIHSDHCDSLLYTGLLSASSTEGIDITQARDNTTGQWYRTPSKDCYQTQRSGSDISRDMFAGLFWSLYYLRDLVSLERILDYGRDHDWIMGQGAIDRTYLTPNFQDTLYRLVGKDYKGPPYAWVDPGKDHQRHVVALNIALRGEISKGISKDMFALVKHFRNLSPRNALFTFLYHRYSDGDQSETIAILADNSLFPEDRLPESKDRCGEWLWVRDETHDSWKPCEEPKTHSGGDLMFIVMLLEKASIH